MNKSCTKCKVHKEATEFSKDKKVKDGRRSYCKLCVKEYQKENKDKLNEYQKEYYRENKDKIKEYYKSNKDKIKEYEKENKDKIKERNKEYHKNRRLSDPLFKMKGNLRSRTFTAFKSKGYSKNTKTQEMLGVDWEIAKKHLERQFTKRMNWSNQGDWHIDHIIPLSSARTEERLKKLCHYTNLQPLWAIDNLIKSDSINGQQTIMRL